MTKGILLAVAGLLVMGGAALAAERTGIIGSSHGPPGLLASEVRLAPGSAHAQEAPPIEVLGAAIDCPPTGAGPEDTQQRYDEQGDSFRVIGTLTSFDAVTAAINGPTGPITANLEQQFDLRGDLSPSSIVELRGVIASNGTRTAHHIQSACATAGVIDCAAENDPQFQLLVDADSFQVTGRLESVTNDQVRVLGPGLIVEISRDAGTQIEGGLSAGSSVKVEGTVLDDRQLRALTVALRCVEPATATPSATAETLQSNEDCDRGPGNRGNLRFELDDGDVDIKRGTVLSAAAGTITVDSPAGPVTVLTDENTDVEGDLASAIEVEVDGELQADDSILASEIKVLCPDASGDDDEDDDRGRGGRDNERGGDGRGRDDEGEGRGNGRGGGDDDDGDD
jgi:hypothetical protein